MRKLSSILLLVLMTFAFTAEAKLITFDSISETKKELTEEGEGQNDLNDLEEAAKTKALSMIELHELFSPFVLTSYEIQNSRGLPYIILDKDKRPPRS